MTCRCYPEFVTRVFIGNVERRANLALATILLQVVYFSCIAFLTFYACGTIYLIFVYLRHLHTVPETPTLPDAQLPKVTVQIPLYNERYVAGRAVDAAAALDYPRNRLHIQILDNSQDNTTNLFKGALRSFAMKGYVLT